jgi:AraC-like DNA-binding protein
VPFLQKRKGDHCFTGVRNMVKQLLLQLMGNGHFAGGNLGLAGTVEAELAMAEGIPVAHAHWRTKDSAGHRPPCINVAAARGFIERRTGGVIGEFFEAFLFCFRLAETAGLQIAGICRPVRLDPIPRAAFKRCSQRRALVSQSLHSGLQTRGIQGIDGECSVAALGATYPAGEPIAGTLRRVDERNVHNLHQFCVPGWQAHAAKLIPDPAAAVLSPFFRQSKPCYNHHEGQVIFLEHTPAAPLNRCIRMLWYARVDAAAHTRERILPTGRVQIILNLARDFLLDCPEGEPERACAPSLIVGARSTYEIVDTSDMADLIGIVFHPGGFAPFAGGAVDLFSNRSVELEDVWGGAARSVRDRLRELPTPAARLQCLEGFLCERFGGRLSRHGLVDFALDHFQRAPGASTVQDVARSIGWSERRFSQVFREQVGFSPKAWTRILRFQRTVQQLHAGVDVPWAEMALDCGYYDQSHFANEFRAFSGIDATTYSARRTVWANHVAAD